MINNNNKDWSTITTILPVKQLSWAYTTPCQTGVASRALGLQQWTETKAILGCKMDVYLPGPGYGPEDSQLQLENRLYKNEHVMKQ